MSRSELNGLPGSGGTRREFLGAAGVAGTLAALGGAALGQTSPGSTALSTFNVRDMGARGDGQHDDTPVVQQAIRQAEKCHGGHIHFPAGRYRLCGSLVFSSSDRIDITGDGWSSTLLHESDEPLLLWDENAPCRDSSVRHLAITAFGKDKSPQVPAILCAGGAERSMFSQLYFNAEGVRMGGGIAVKKVMDTTTLDHCLMWGVTGTGLEVARGAEVRIFGARITGHDRYADTSIGVDLTGNNGGVHIVTTDIIALHTALVIGHESGPSNREIFITHATFDSCLHGIVQRDRAYVSIAGCWAASSDEEQILLDHNAGGAIMSISGGTIFNGGAYGKGGANHGIVVRAGSFMLTGVTVRHNKGTGILIEGDKVRDYTITGCRIADNGAPAVLRGDGYSVTGNVLARNGAKLIDAGGPHKQVANNVVA